ncbi:Catalyzes methyl transfer from S-methylmethionine (SMM) to adenosyl-L-homocysteine (AdoMet) [Balamuthia mandrillaris]
MRSRRTLKQAASASSRQTPRAAAEETPQTCVKVKEEHDRCDDYVEDSAEEEEVLSVKLKKEQREDGRQEDEEGEEERRRRKKKKKKKKHKKKKNKKKHKKEEERVFSSSSNGGASSSQTRQPNNRKRSRNEEEKNGKKKGSPSRDVKALCPDEHEPPHSRKHVSRQEDSKKVATEELSAPVFQSPCKTLQLYRAQLNIGKRMLETLLQMNTIKRHKTYSSIRVIFIGPSFVELSKQTQKDWNLYWQTMENVRGRSLINIKSIPFEYGERACWNSNSLGKASAFHAGLGNSSCLNVVIHDEYHWGAAHQSKVFRFFQDIAKSLDQYPETDCAIVAISATGELLLELEDLSPTVLRWRELRLVDEEFACPGYVSVEHLPIKSVRMPEEAEHRRLQLAENYAAAFAALPKYTDSIEGTVLKAMIEERKMVIVRLPQTMPEFVTDVQEAAKRFRNFCVVDLTKDGTPLHDQLPPHLQKRFNRETVCITHLENVACFVVVVHRLSVGMRIPRSCAFYDLRARHAGQRDQCPNYQNISYSSRTSFFQDIGRCAGYYQKGAVLPTVLLNQTTYKSFTQNNWKYGDRLLTVDGRPSKRHSHRYGYDEDEEINEEGVSIYERLLKHLLLLDAEPQIGKTGAALSFLGALEEWIFNNQIKKGSVTNDAGKMEPCALLNRLTKEAHFRCAGGAPCWPTPDDYERYHICLEEERTQSWKLSDPTTFIAQQLSQHRKVADCGCGSGFLFRQLSQLNSRTTVHGYDVDPSILLLAQGPPSRTQFVPHVGDVLEELPSDTPFSAVVFSLSFFLNDITNHVRTAWSALRSESEDNNAGELFIADVAVRFPKDFVACVESNGFTKLQEQRLGQFAVLRFQKEEKRGEKKLVRLFDPA